MPHLSCRWLFRLTTGMGNALMIAGLSHFASWNGLQGTPCSLTKKLTVASHKMRDRGERRKPRGKRLGREARGQWQGAEKIHAEFGKDATCASSLLTSRLAQIVR